MHQLFKIFPSQQYTKEKPKLVAMKVLLFLAFLVVALNCIAESKPFPSSKTETPPIVGPDGKTQPPWLKFLKNKKTTPNPDFVSTNPISISVTTPTSVLKCSNCVMESSYPNKAINSVRAIPASASVIPVSVPQQQSDMDELAKWLGIYVQPSGDILADDRQQNPGTLYDEYYLDWMKRRDLQETATATYGNPVDGANQDPLPVPQPQTMLGYPYPVAVPLSYGFYPGLAGFKIQKAMAQAQMDAALATALNITTTPKPLKLKLKIMVPGNVNLTQLGQITAGLAQTLPVGSTYELD